MNTSAIKYLQPSSCLEPPYRLIGPEEIKQAMSQDLLGLGNKAYEHMLEFATQNRLVLPPALLAAAPQAVQSFHIVLKEKIRECKVSYEEIAGLNPVEKFPLIQAALKLPTIDKTTSSLFSVLDHYPDKVKKQLGISEQLKPSQYFDAILSVRKFIKQEMLSCARTGRPQHMNLTDFKSLLAAYTVFLPGNENILEAVSSLPVIRQRQTVYQNAMAELLFARLPPIPLKYKCA